MFASMCTGLVGEFEHFSLLDPLDIFGIHLQNNYIILDICDNWLLSRYYKMRSG